MRNKKNIPDIRFKGFTEEWNNELLGQLATFSKGRGYSKGDLLEEGTQIILYGRLYTKYQTVISNVDTFAIQKKDSVLSKGIEVVVPSSGETAEDISRASAIIRPNTIIAGDLNIIYPNRDIDAVFLALLISNGDAQKNLSKKAQGKSVVHLHNSDLNGIELNHPVVDEQKAIGNYFQGIDRLINTSQTKLNKLKNIKKACLEKMFPFNGSNTPKLRFKGFMEEWEEKILGVTKTYYTDGNYGSAYPKPSDMTDSDSGVPFLKGSNICNGRLSKQNANHITYIKHLELSSGHLQEDDIVITVRGSLGALGYADKGNVNWNINSQLAIIRTDKKELIGSFLIQHMLSDKGQGMIMSKISGSALKQLPIGQLKDISIPITKVEEQKAMGVFFKNLDDLIIKTEQQLDKLKNIKKACLDKMFVNMED